jgi:hypothetical protein
MENHENSEADNGGMVVIVVMLWVNVALSKD